MCQLFLSQIIGRVLSASVWSFHDADQSLSQSENPMAQPQVSNGHADLEKAPPRSSAQPNGFHNFSDKQSLDTFSKPQIVTFDGPDDPANPLNWSYARRAIYTMLLGLLTAGATFGSAIFSQSIATLSEIYGVSREVMVCLFIFFEGRTATPTPKKPKGLTKMMTARHSCSDSHSSSSALQLVLSVLDLAVKSLVESHPSCCPTLFTSASRLLKAPPKIFQPFSSPASSLGFLQVHLCPTRVVLWPTCTTRKREAPRWWSTPSLLWVVLWSPPLSDRPSSPLT